MKQTNPGVIEKSRQLLVSLKEKRGGSVLTFHKQIANDPDLLASFNQQYDICIKNLHHIPRKYKELMIMALGCALKAQTTINVHAKLAVEHGATVEELGETLRLVFMLAGATSLIPAAEIFEPLECIEE